MLTRVHSPWRVGLYSSALYVAMRRPPHHDLKPSVLTGMPAPRSRRRSTPPLVDVELNSRRGAGVYVGNDIVLTAASMLPGSLGAASGGAADVVRTHIGTVEIDVASWDAAGPLGVLRLQPGHPFGNGGPSFRPTVAWLLDAEVSEYYVIARGFADRARRRDTHSVQGTLTCGALDGLRHSRGHGECALLASASVTPEGFLGAPVFVGRGKLVGIVTHVESWVGDDPVILVSPVFSIDSESDDDNLLAKLGIQHRVQRWRTSSASEHQLRNITLRPAAPDEEDPEGEE